MERSRLLFPLDKNYTLKQVQLDVKAQLLQKMIDLVIDHYLRFGNPLGIEDDTVMTIRACNKYALEHFDTFYHELAGVYRYKIGSNQLEFVFSGRSHYDKYLDDWSEAFNIWIEDFLSHHHFIKAVLEMAVFHPKGRVAFLAGNRLKAFLSQYFHLKVYKYRGILPLQVA